MILLISLRGRIREKLIKTNFKEAIVLKIIFRLVYFYKARVNYRADRLKVEIRAILTPCVLL